MGIFKLTDGTLVPLRSPHLLGRSRSMHTTLRLTDVSSQHASLSWDGERWRLRDLASRNGTRVDGNPLPAGVDQPLARGAVLELGCPQARLELVDDSPPAIIAQGPEGLRWGDDSMLTLPDDDDPQAIVMRDPLKGWLLGEGSDTSPVMDGQQVTVQGRTWTLLLPETVAPTSDVSALNMPDDTVAIEVRVSTDGEYIEVHARGSAGAVSLAPRAHHAVLLVLARQRIEDADEPEAEQGWIYRDLLHHELQMSSNQLYVSIHRLRKEFEKHNLMAGAQLIEQRKTTHQVRLGTAQVTIRPL